MDFGSCSSSFKATKGEYPPTNTHPISPEIPGALGRDPIAFSWGKMEQGGWGIKQMALGAPKKSSGGVGKIGQGPFGDRTNQARKAFFSVGRNYFRSGCLAPKP